MELTGLTALLAFIALGAGCTVEPSPVVWNKLASVIEPEPMEEGPPVPGGKGRLVLSVAMTSTAESGCVPERLQPLWIYDDKGALVREAPSAFNVSINLVPGRYILVPRCGTAKRRCQVVIKAGLVTTVNLAEEF